VATATPSEPGRGAPGRALAWFAAAALLVIAWLSHLFATGLLLGALAGFTLQPAYDRLARWSRRPLLASVVTVLATGLVIVGAVVGFVSSFVTQAVALIGAAREGLKPGGVLLGWIDTATGWLGRFGLSTEKLTERLQSAVAEVASGSAAAAGTVASVTFMTLLGLFFALLTMHVILRHWPRIVTTLEAVSPLRPEYTRALLEEFRRVGRLTLSGTIVTGLAQGVLAGLGYWITGVPKPLFLAVATAIASLVPAVGTLLIWVPAGLYLFAVGSPTMGIVELLWGALVVVGFSDYVIRPRLVGDEEMPVILTFLALFGGLEVMGLIGLIAGPVVMALAVAVLRLYAREAGVRGKKARG
jgi:predicted PurR-regulated permease PerM